MEAVLASQSVGAGWVDTVTKGFAEAARQFADLRGMLFVPAVSMAGIGLWTMFFATQALSRSRFGNPYHYFIGQLVAILIGVSAAGLGYWLASRTERLSRLALPLFWFGFAIAATTLLVGATRGGARRWVEIGGLAVNASSLLSVTFLVYFCFTLHDVVSGRKHFMMLVWPLGLSAALMALQPDLFSAVLILTVCTATAYIARPWNWKWSALAVATFLVSLALSVLLEPYRLGRILAIMNPWTDAHGSGFQYAQSMIAIGSGGVIGKGPGPSLMLPGAHSDFIVSNLAQSYGLLGITVLVVLVGSLVIGMIDTSAVVQPAAHSYLTLAAGLFVAVQSLANFGAVTSVLPTGGAMLPLVSYGWNGVAAPFFLIGMVARFGWESRDRATPLDNVRLRIALELASASRSVSLGIFGFDSAFQGPREVEADVRVKALRTLALLFNRNPRAVSEAVLSVDHSDFTPAEQRAARPLNQMILNQNPQDALTVLQRASGRLEWSSDGYRAAVERLEDDSPSEAYALFNAISSSELDSLIAEALTPERAAVPPSQAIGDIQIEHLLGELLHRRDAVIVDFGAGTGRLVQGLLSFGDLLGGFEYIGVESDTRRAKQLHDFCESSGFSAMAKSVQCVDSGSFSNLSVEADIIFMVNVLHEIQLRDLPDVFTAMFRNLRVGGLLLMHDMRRLPKGEPSFFTWEPNGVRKLLKDTGFNVGIREHSSRGLLPLMTIVATKEHRGSLEEDALLCRAIDIYRERKREVLAAIARLEGKGEDIAGDSRRLREYVFLQALNTNIDTQLLALEG